MATLPGSVKRLLEQDMPKFIDLALTLERYIKRRGEDWDTHELSEILEDIGVKDGSK
jgi:hypothetical protein